PTGGGDSHLADANPDSFNAESVAQVNAMLEEQNESKSAWKIMAQTAKKNSFNQEGIFQNMGHDAYKVYSGTSHE
ncbi:MAG: hypothetical protein HQL68_07510, partial [Magnetococcales bacterium]|nr:hypothetical protein [Magnetococcales bacterium]